MIVTKEHLFDDHLRYLQNKEKRSRSMADSTIEGSYMDVGSDFEMSEENIDITEELFSDEKVHNQKILDENLDALERDDDYEIAKDEEVLEEEVPVVEGGEKEVDPIAMAFDVKAKEDTPAEAIEEYTETIEENMDETTEDITESFKEKMDGFEVKEDKVDLEDWANEQKSTFSEIKSALSIDGIKSEIGEMSKSNENVLSDIKDSIDNEEDINILDNFKVKDINKSLNDMGVEKDSFSNFYNNTEDKDMVEQTLESLFNKLDDPNNQYELQNLFNSTSLNNEYDSIKKGKNKGENSLDNIVDEKQEEFTTEISTSEAAKQYTDVMKDGFDAVMQEV